jgi:hypothetical protein
MDASIGQVNWRKTNQSEEKKKKEGKKPHWLIAKEHGKKRSGSEKRQLRKQKEANEGEEVRFVGCDWVVFVFNVVYFL